MEGDKKLEIPADGVYIEGLDRRAYTVYNWQGGNAANSVIVASGDVMFRMALTPRSGMYMSNDPYEFLEKHMTPIEDETAAKADYDGAGNTEKLLIEIPSTSYAAGYCNAFTFPDGKTKGYLPSLGQLWLAYQNKEAVSAALTACGGTAMSTSTFSRNYYWSSTFWDVGGNLRYCWIFDWLNDGYVLNGYNLNWDAYVRPFADIS